MEKFTQNSRKNRILKALQDNEFINKDNENDQTENQIMVDDAQAEDKIMVDDNQTKNILMVDDLQTFMAKAVYGDQFQAPVPNVSQRLKQLHAWQTVRRGLIEKIFKHIQDIELLEKKSVKASARKIDDNAKETMSVPQNIQTMLNLSDGNMVTLGPNGTQIRKEVLVKMNWSLSNANITRKFLMELFDRETLATHTLSGKPSPAFVGCNKPTKMQLNPYIVQDIIHIMTNSLEMTEKDVRQAITTKCADENKMFRLREERRRGIAKRRCTNCSMDKAFGA